MSKGNVVGDTTEYTLSVKGTFTGFQFLDFANPGNNINPGYDSKLSQYTEDKPTDVYYIQKYTGQEDALEESVLTLLQDYDMVDECIIGSMNKGILQKMKELEPGISTVFIAHDLEEEDYELDYADSYSIEGRNLTVDMVDAIHYCGKSVYGWTANTSGAMLRIVNCGADGVITDDVRLLQTFLREQACRKAFASVY